MSVLQLDLSDLASVKMFAEKVQALLDGRKLDVLVRWSVQTCFHWHE